jgi:hypothetical protein
MDSKSHVFSDFLLAILLTFFMEPLPYKKFSLEDLIMAKKKVFVSFDYNCNYYYFI